MTFGNNIPEIPDTVYIIFQKNLFKRIEEHFEFDKVKFTRGDLYVEKNNEFAIITGVGVGESASLMLAEELSAVGVKKVISLGIVGSISDKLDISDLVIVENSFSQSNIFDIYDYDKKNIPTSSEQNNEIFEKIKVKDIKFVNGVSVPTIYCETKDMVEKSRQNGVEIIDMETASLSLVFFKRGVMFSAIGCVSDILEKEGWRFENKFSKIFDLLEEVFLRLTKDC